MVGARIWMGSITPVGSVPDWIIKSRASFGPVFQKERLTACRGHPPPTGPKAHLSMVAVVAVVGGDGVSLGDRSGPRGGHTPRSEDGWDPSPSFWHKVLWTPLLSSWKESHRYYNQSRHIIKKQIYCLNWKVKEKLKESHWQQNKIFFSL